MNEPQACNSALFSASVLVEAGLPARSNNKYSFIFFDFGV
jgi:hypothetical protein